MSKNGSAKPTSKAEAGGSKKKPPGRRPEPMETKLIQESKARPGMENISKGEGGRGRGGGS